MNKPMSRGPDSLRIGVDPSPVGGLSFREAAIEHCMLWTDAGRSAFGPGGITRTSGESTSSVPDTAEGAVTGLSR